MLRSRALLGVRPIYADNDISIASVYLTEVPTLCDEMPRWSPENQRESSKPGWESPAGRSRKASLIPNYILVRIKLRRNVTAAAFLPTKTVFWGVRYGAPQGEEEPAEKEWV